MLKLEKALIPTFVPQILAVSLLGVAILNGEAAFAQRSAERTGPDSFLTFQIESTEELAAVLRSDPVLRKRYAKHFGVPESQVISFVERALVPYRLPSDRTMTVYGVSKAGKIYAVKTHLRRGTRVWATRSGTPILKWLCANPFTNKLPEGPLTQPVTSRPPVLTNIATMPEQDVMSEALAPTSIASYTPDVPLVGTAVATAAEVPPSVLVAPSVQELAGSNLGALGLAFVPFLFRNGDTPPGEIIPEPGTIALVAMGALPLAMAIRRRRRASR